MVDTLKYLNENGAFLIICLWVAIWLGRRQPIDLSDLPRHITLDVNVTHYNATDEEDYEND